MIMNVYRNIDREKVQFDFVIHTEDECYFDNEIKSLGGRIFSVPRFNGKNYFAYRKAWKKLLENHSEWKVVHGHMRSTASIYLPVAKKLGRVTIAHSHSISSGKGLSACVKNLLQLPIRRIADYLFACSENAGEWLFGKKAIKTDRYFTVRNAIDIESFKYNEKTRQQMRKELNISDSFVIGNIGRLEAPKNHLFLLKVFKEISERCDNAVLLLVGDGSLKADIESEIKSLKLEDKVIMLGIREDTQMILQAMDFFLFPSLFEGLGIALIEAQSAGLRCLTSKDVVPLEAKVTNLLTYISLQSDVKSWADEVLKYSDGYQRNDTSAKIAQAGYDIKESTRNLQKFYMEKGI